MLTTEIGITFRKLIHRPAFTLAAIATLAVGIGATTAVFSTVNATLLRPLPFSEPDALYSLRTIYPDGRFTNGRMAGAYMAAITESATTVERAVALTKSDAVIRTDDGQNRHVLTHTVEADFFDLFGLPPAAGRYPTPEEGRVAVISYRIWDEMFGRAPEVVGRALRLSNGSVTLVGVASPEFDLPAGTGIWFSGQQIQATATGHGLEAFLRVRPGTTPAQLEGELDAIMARMGELYPATAAGRVIVATPLIEAIVGDLGPILLIVLAGAVVLLVLGCVNVAMLILARGAAQTKELAVRAAMGAPRRSIVAQFLTESFVLAAAGTLAGALLAFLGVKLLLTFGGSGLPRLDQVPFDARVLVFATLTLVAATVLVALTPALRLSNPDIRGLLGEQGRSTTAGRGTVRLLSGFVVAEIALAVALVSGAGWLVRSYVNVASTDAGFEPSGRLVFEVLLSGSSFVAPPVVTQLPDGTVVAQPAAGGGNPALWLAALRERLTASGQVTAVGSASSFPLRLDWDGSGYIGVPGSYSEAVQDNARRRNVSPGFFEALGTPVIAGRTLVDGDGGSIAVVNEEFVRRYFPGKEDVVGETFAYGFPTPNFNAPLTIVGVVGDVRYLSLDQPAEPTVYSLGTGARQTVVVATSAADPSALISLVRAAVAELDASVPVTIEPLQEIVSATTLRHRLGLALMVLFATLSLALAAVGIYGVVAHATGQRWPEVATRLALGATPSHVIRQLMTEGRGLALVGLSLGVATALAGGRLITSRLYEVRAVDPLILLVAAAAVLAVTLLAYLLPALRASRIHPAESLRSG